MAYSHIYQGVYVCCTVLYVRGAVVVCKIILLFSLLVSVFYIRRRVTSRLHLHRHVPVTHMAQSPKEGGGVSSTGQSEGPPLTVYG